MADHIIPARPIIEELDQWFRNARVYTYGNPTQQSLKLLRHLGKLCESQQKMENLEVAKSVGEMLTTAVGLLGFLPYDKDVISESFDKFLPKTFNRSKQKITLEIARHTVQFSEEVISCFEGGGGPNAGSMLAMRVDLLLYQLRILCRNSGLEFDRVFYNAAQSLLKKKGQMNELGLFEPTN